MALQFQHLTTVVLSDEERVSQTISPEHAATAIYALQRDGLVCLENAVDTAHVDRLQQILAAESEIMAKLPTTHFNDNSVDGKPTGNMSQGPPLDTELLFNDIWANGPAACVISSVIGPNSVVNYVNGNTALGGFNGARQNVHADLTFNHAPFPFSLVTNYYLSDTSAANGSTEVWLGSHRDTSLADHKTFEGKTDEQEVFGIRDDLLDKRRAFAPPIQGTVKRGSVVIRDLRLWHAGLCNPFPTPRIMLAFVHSPWWYQCPNKVVLPAAAKQKVKEWEGLRHSVLYSSHFVPEEVDHKSVKFTPIFHSENKGYIAELPKLGTSSN